MKFFRFVPWLAVVVLAGCAPDRTLETLIPGRALAVVMVDHPGLVVPNLGPWSEVLPWAALDGTRPWAAVVVPGTPPRFRLFLALGSSETSWTTVARWAATTGGLVVDRAGGYAVLSMPGLEPVVPLAAADRFDVQRLRGEGRLVEAYVDASVLPGSPVPGLKDQLRGLFVAVRARSGGVETLVTSDWRPGSPWQNFFSRVAPPASWSGWMPVRPASGVAVAVNLPPPVWSLGGLSVDDPGLRAWWAALAPQLGPRAALVAESVAEPAPEKGWSWRSRIEAPDPQAVRQALKTLVAGGLLQKEFPAWALDPDTPVIYQDQMDGGPLTAKVSVGDRVVALAYGRDRVVAAGAAGAVEAVGGDLASPSPAQKNDLPPRTIAVGTGAVDGLGASGSLSVESDGNLTLRLFVDSASLGAWQERLPQAFRQWAASTTLWEP